MYNFKYYTFQIYSVLRKYESNKKEQFIRLFYKRDIVYDIYKYIHSVTFDYYSKIRISVSKPNDLVIKENCHIKKYTFMDFMDVYNAYYIDL